MQFGQLTGTVAILNNETVDFTAILKLICLSRLWCLKRDAEIELEDS